MTVPEDRARKVLVLAPTRELAVQIEGEAEKLGKYIDVKCGAFYGGVSYGPQVDMLRNNVQVLIGTPGRIIDLVQQGKMLLKEVGFLVIDEADRMFDMGFIDDIRKLLRYLPPAGDRQTFLFSATLGLRVKDLAWEYMVDPVEISIEPEHVTVDLVTQELYHVGSHEKLPLLLGLLDREKPESSIIFCNQKFMVEELARRLKINGYDCEYIMGDLPQAKRSEIIDDLKAGKIHMLVATDVAARGLDIEALDLVVNYDVPEEAESYVHRIGRTARAGKAGKAITLACEKFVFGLPPIEKFIGSKIPVCPVDTALLFEDKSHDMRFHSDRAEGGRGRSDSGRGYSGSARGGSGRGGDGRGRPADGRRRPEGNRPPRSEDSARQGERRQPEGRGREDQRRSPAPRRPQEAAQGQSRRMPETQGAGRPPREGANPYAVSQEERMRQYKEKYKGGQQGNGPRPQGQKPSGATAGARPARRPAAQAAPHNATRDTSRNAPRNAPRNATGAAPRKPGLVDRIKSLFGGKKQK